MGYEYFDSPSSNDDDAGSVAENKPHVYRVGRRRRRDDAWSNVGGIDSIALDGEAATVRIQHREGKNNRLLWSATGIFLVSLIFLTVHAAVESSAIFETRLSVESLTMVEQPSYRHSNLRHRRLNQEREQGDDRHKHATSYAQRHHTYKGQKYTSGNPHYYYGNGYGFMEQQETDEVHRRYSAPKTNLSDVWLCLSITLGCVVVG